MAQTSLLKVHEADNATRVSNRLKNFHALQEEAETNGLDDFTIEDINDIVINIRQGNSVT